MYCFFLFLPSERSRSLWIPLCTLYEYHAVPWMWRWAPPLLCMSSHCISLWMNLCWSLLPVLLEWYNVGLSHICLLLYLCFIFDSNACCISVPLSAFLPINYYYTTKQKTIARLCLMINATVARKGHKRNSCLSLGREILFLGQREYLWPEIEVVGRQMGVVAVMRHWRSDGGNPSGTVELGRACSCTSWRLVCMQLAQVHQASVARCAGAATSHGQTCLYRWPPELRHWTLFHSLCFCVRLSHLNEDYLLTYFLQVQRARVRVRTTFIN